MEVTRKCLYVNQKYYILKMNKSIVVVGGIAVTVTGAGFDSSHVVKLDGSAICKTQSVSLTNIICVLPAVSVALALLECIDG